MSTPNSLPNEKDVAQAHPEAYLAGINMSKEVIERSGTKESDSPSVGRIAEIMSGVGKDAVQAMESMHGDEAYALFYGAAAEFGRQFPETLRSQS